MKIVLPNQKPRNPLVKYARLRRAGLHAVPNERQSAKKEIRNEIKTFKD